MVVDKILRAGVKVVENILLSGQVSAQMPRLAILRTPAKVGHDERVTLLQPGPPIDTAYKTRRFADTVPAVTIDKGGHGSVHRRSTPMDDGHGNLCPILRGCEKAVNYVAGNAHVRGLRKRCGLQLSMRTRMISHVR